MFNILYFINKLFKIILTLFYYHIINNYFTNTLCNIYSAFATLNGHERLSLR